MMHEETQAIVRMAAGVEPTKPTGDSSLGGISIRAWLATILVGTVCLNHLLITFAIMIDAIIRRDFTKIGTFTTVGEPLYSMAVAALGFYFGQKVTPPAAKA